MFTRSSTILFRKTNSSNICGYLINARSIANKLSALHYLLYDTSIDMCFINETWLHDGISSGVLDPKCEFTVLQKDCLKANVPFEYICRQNQRNTV